jgi:peptide/nickel transport system permease protein
VSEVAISFLGFGVQDPTPTWGNMMGFATSYMFNHPWMPLIPGLPIFLCFAGVQLYWRWVARRA